MGFFLQDSDWIATTSGSFHEVSTVKALVITHPRRGCWESIPYTHTYTNNEMRNNGKCMIHRNGGQLEINNTNCFIVTCHNRIKLRKPIVHILLIHHVIKMRLPSLCASISFYGGRSAWPWLSMHCRFVLIREVCPVKKRCVVLRPTLGRDLCRNCIETNEADNWSSSHNLIPCSRN